MAKKGAPSPSTKWLNLWALCNSYRSATRGAGMVRLSSVFYFTALAHHIDQKKPGVVARHSTYIEALKTTGVIPVLGKFKKAGDKECPKCGTKILRHEEKETDVNISVKMLELLVRDEADIIMVVSGDTDLIPAIRTARNLFPTKPVGCLFPWGRSNQELKMVCSFYASIGLDQCARLQLPDPVAVQGQRVLHKPPMW